jgi:hypothetical protein
LTEPLLAEDKHVAIGEHLDNVTLEALSREGVPPPEDALAGFEPATAFEERKLGRRLHLTEHLSNGELLVEEESLAVRRSEGNGTRRDAGRLSAADEMHFTALGYGLLGRGDVRAGRRVSVDGFDVDGACEEGAVRDGLESKTHIRSKEPT